MPLPTHSAVQFLVSSSINLMFMFWAILSRRLALKEGMRLGEGRMARRRLFKVKKT